MCPKWERKVDWRASYLMYAVEQLPVVTRHVVRDLSGAEHLEETARPNFRTFLVGKRRLYIQSKNV